MSLFTIPEIRLQRPLHRLLSNPARVWTTVDGEEIQVIAAGILNMHEGPDFTNVAVMNKGVLYVGSGEFHHKASNWNQHDHGANPMYGLALLHVVLENDCTEHFAKFTLEVSSKELGAELAQKPSPLAISSMSVTDELQQCALQRLLRNTSSAHSLIQRLGVSQALVAFAGEWFSRFVTKRRRPYPTSVLQHVQHSLVDSALGNLAISVSLVEPTLILQRIEEVEQSRIREEGSFLRREIFTNVILPFCCAQAEAHQRAVLLQWYWSARAFERYGHLQRRFPTIVQDYVWQQQGMLEYIRAHGNVTQSCAENIARYGFAKTLQFLQCV